MHTPFALDALPKGIFAGEIDKNSRRRKFAVCLFSLFRGGPFTAVLDLASNSTAGNWAAARDLDVTSMAQGQSSSYPRETGRSRPLMCAQFDTVRRQRQLPPVDEASLIVAVPVVPVVYTVWRNRSSLFVCFVPLT